MLIQKLVTKKFYVWRVQAKSLRKLFNTWLSLETALLFCDKFSTFILKGAQAEHEM